MVELGRPGRRRRTLLPGSSLGGGGAELPRQAGAAADHPAFPGQLLLVPMLLPTLRDSGRRQGRRQSPAALLCRALSVTRREPGRWPW